MIVEIPKPKSPYEKFFVFEAPKKKKSVKIITVNPNKRNTDFSRNADKFDDLPEDEDGMELVADDEMGDIDLDEEDYTSVEPENQPETEPNNNPEINMDDNEDYNPSNQSPDNDEPPTPDNNPDTENIEQNENEVQPTQSGSEETPDDNSPPNIDNENYSPTGDETGEGEEQPEEAPSTPHSSKPFDEQIRIYNLYKRFLNLYNSVKSYISKMDGLVKDSHDANLIVRTSTSQLREIESLLQDYMIFQFQNASYVKSLLFYEKALTSVQLVFNLLENINVNDSSNLKQ